MGWLWLLYLVGLAALAFWTGFAMATGSVKPRRRQAAWRLHE